MKLLKIIPMLILLGCSTPEEPPAPQAPSYRDQSQPIASAALFEPARFAGTWHEVAGYTNGLQGCAPGTWAFTPAPQGFTVTASCPQARAIATLEPAGRMKLIFETGETLHLWVLWVDEGYRTAVIGTPDGTVGWIFNRSAELPTDRRTAAREMLDFNGYDLERLKERR